MWVTAIYLPDCASPEKILQEPGERFENIPPVSESAVQSRRPIDLGILSDRD
jgi:hypothetical protein